MKLALLTLAATALWAGTASPQEVDPPTSHKVSPSPSPSPSTSPDPSRSNALASAPRRLKLGPYRTGASDASALPPPGRDPLRFESRVDVYGRALDSAALTAKLEWWLAEFDPDRGATPGGAPTLYDMRDFRPTPAPAADFAPLIKWLLGKVKKDKSER